MKLTRCGILSEISTERKKSNLIVKKPDCFEKLVLIKTGFDYIEQGFENLSCFETTFLMSFFSVAKQSKHSSAYLSDVREMIYFFRRHEIFISWFVANSVKMGEKKPNTAIKSQVVKNVQTILYVPMQ